MGGMLDQTKSWRICVGIGRKRRSKSDMSRKEVIVIGFLQALGRHIILPAIEAAVYTFTSEKVREWAEKKDLNAHPEQTEVVESNEIVDQLSKKFDERFDEMDEFLKP